MYEWKDKIKNLSGRAVPVIIGLAVICVAVAAGYMLGLRNAGRADKSDHHGGAEQVGQHIQSAIARQGEITERIDGLQNGAAQISGGLETGAAGVDKAAAAVGRAENLVSGSGDLIAEGQRILATVRNRREKN